MLMKTLMEHRKYIRIKKSVAIKHIKFHWLVNENDALRSLAKDISAGGILFESAEFYDVGDIIRLEIDLPGWEDFKSEYYKPHLSKSQPVIALVRVRRIFLR